MYNCINVSDNFNAHLYLNDDLSIIVVGVGYPLCCWGYLHKQFKTKKIDKCINQNESQ